MSVIGTIPETARVVLAPRKARPFHGRHPWVLDAAIQRIEGEAQAGDVVDLVSNEGQWIARGLYNPHSRIRVRLYTWQADELLADPAREAAFWRRRLEAALAARAALAAAPDEALRLVYSEADGLSGLVIDRYGDYLVVQV